MNTPQLFADLDTVLAELESGPPSGLIITSAKPRSFNAGADLFELRGLSLNQLDEYLREGQRLFNRLARLPFPTVAAINADALGGGLELALACTYRLVADTPSICLGLPEVKLGVVPAWGGTTRLPRLTGLRRALPLLLTGRTLTPRQAMEARVVDGVAPPQNLLTAARRLISSPPPPRERSRIERTLTANPHLRNRLLERTRRQLDDKTYGNYPAPLRLIEVVRIGYDRGFDAGLEAEREALIDLVQTEAGKNLLRLFFLRQEARKRATEQCGGATPPEIRRVAAIGGGTMGAGIVQALLAAGFPVTLVEASAPTLEAALRRIGKTADASKPATGTAGHLTPTTSWDAIRDADLVIEAVFEDPSAKHEVFAQLARVASPSAILASNTSSLSVTELARATTHPERVIGLHFFNPVAKMPLVEVVRTALAEPAALAAAVALVTRLGKTPVLVNDSPGFIVNRVLFPYLAEALAAAADGVPIDRIDDSMRRWGMPIGPFELLDEIGLDVAACILRSLEGKAREPSTPATVLRQAVARGELGSKSGRGFYIHTAGHRNALLANGELLAVLFPRSTQQPSTPKLDAIQQRLLAPMVAHARRLLDEHVVDSADAIDLATVLGLGLAPFRGGLASYALLGTAAAPQRRSMPAPAPPLPTSPVPAAHQPS